MIPHTITLQMVHRQREQQLIQAIQEVATGEVSHDTTTFIRSLSRPLSGVVRPVKLCARNEMVDDINRQGILEWPGELYEFKSIDEGTQSFLTNRVTAPKILWLKKGAPVILLRNISDQLVNGLQGYIHAINGDGPVIAFPALDTKIPLKKTRFSGNCT